MAEVRAAVGAGGQRCGGWPQGIVAVSGSVVGTTSRAP